MFLTENALKRLYRWLCFSQVTVCTGITQQPAIVLAAHYNGLLDGFVYTSLSDSLLGMRYF